ncbi:MAG: Uma2 family endonuclease [Defluviitaleaceae bacterium]|nr:Uma2 family endonuclease [Defluviitaleaceae bacterium]
MAIRKEQRVSYEEWREMDFGENARSELIDGRIYMMSSPSTRHQIVAGNMFGQLFNHLSGKKCKVLFSPFAVRLKDDTEVQPDLVVICDPKKITPSGCNGAPDLVIEILSPSTARHDRYTKFMLYAQSGVPEYWMVDPEENVITICRLVENGYLTTVLTNTEIATVAALPDFQMDLSTVFAEE